MVYVMANIYGMKSDFDSVLKQILPQMGQCFAPGEQKDCPLIPVFCPLLWRYAALCGMM
jgi:hypothetical protein